ncbi:MAG TPA: HAD family hydrolase [Planktothrix sp.]|jgi:FMN phosphatase YigB (HAD superfamily)
MANFDQDAAATKSSAGRSLSDLLVAVVSAPFVFIVGILVWVRQQLPKDRKAVGTDLDGTVWNFFSDAFFPGMQEAVPTLARKLFCRLGKQQHCNIHVGPAEMDVISKALGVVIERRGTHDWPWLIEESALWQDPKYRELWASYAEFRREMVEPFWRAVDRTRHKYLRLFPEVAESFDALHAHGKKIYALSDAPAYNASRKVVETNLAHRLDALYALDTPEPTDWNLTEEEKEFGRQRIKDVFAELPCKLVILPVHYEKPNPEGFFKLMTDNGLRPQDVIYVGDSLKKDGGVAANVRQKFLKDDSSNAGFCQRVYARIYNRQVAEVAFLWAEYGTYLPTVVRKMVEVHFHPTRTHLAPNTVKYPKMAARISNWSLVLGFINNRIKLQEVHLNPSAHSQPVEGSGH